jgi:hypothetical protein
VNLTGSALKILHVFDHSVPRPSGYARRSIALLEAQRRLGWHTLQLTSPHHDMPGPTYEEVAGFAFHRTAPVAKTLERAPVLRDIARIHLTARRIRHIASYQKPDLIHAHAPALNAIAATWAGKKLGIPTVYEFSFSEDVASDRAGSLHDRARRLLETYACGKADAIVSIRESLFAGLIARTIPGLPNALLASEPGTDGETQAYLAAYSRALGRPVTAIPTTFRSAVA